MSRSKTNQSDKAFDSTLDKLYKSAKPNLKQTRSLQDQINQKETKMKKLSLKPEAKGAIKTIFATLFIIGLIATGWMLHDQFDAHVTAKATELASKTSQ